MREYNKAYISMRSGAGRKLIGKSFPEKIIFKLRPTDQINEGSARPWGIKQYLQRPHGRKKHSSFKLLSTKRDLGPREGRQGKVSQVLVSCGLEEKPLISFKWKGNDQLYLIKNRFIHTVRMDSDKLVGNPRENWWCPRPKDDSIREEAVRVKNIKRQYWWKLVIN